MSRWHLIVDFARRGTCARPLRTEREETAEDTITGA